MARENFLINPPKKLRRKIKKEWLQGKQWIGRSKSGRFSKIKKIYYEKNPIGETLITIGANPMRKNPENPWFGDPNGHRIAALMRWGKLPKGRVKRYRKRGRPSVRGFAVVKKRRKSVARKRTRIVRRRGFIGGVGRARVRTGLSSGVTMRGARRRSVFPHSTFGMYTGGREFSHNPFSGRLSMRKRKRSSSRRRVRKSNSWFGQPRRHRRAAKKGWRRGHLLKKGGARRRRVRHANPIASNPIRHRRRSRRGVRRHNPMFGGTVGQFTSGIMNVRDWAPLAVTGGLSAITGSVVPQMIGVVNPWARLGVQTAVAIGGGLVVEKVVDKRHGQAWMIVGVAMVGYQLLKQFVLVPYFPQFAIGLGGYQDYYPNSAIEEGDEVSQQVGAFPGQVGAFVNDYPGVGGEDMGAYPYDGAGY